MTIDQQFNTIHDKLLQLIKAYSRVQKENDRLRDELQKARDNEKLMQHRLDEMQQQVSIIKLGTGEMNDRDKKEFEKKINRYIKEIDKCISYLSE
jgi:septation ring formation regulator EzrA